MPRNRRVSIAAGVLIAWLVAMGCTTAPSEVDEADAQIAKLRLEQSRLLKQVRREVSLLPPVPPSERDEPPQVTEKRIRYRDMAMRLAEVEGNIAVDTGSRSRLISVLSEEPAFQAYLRRFRARVQEAGNLDLPTENGKPIHGRVIVLLTVNSTGQVEELEIVDATSSALSMSTRNLIQRLAPFEAFGPDVRELADQVVIGTTFRYVPE